MRSRAIIDILIRNCTKEGKAVETKCQVCGAPMENGRCGYCGYVGKKEETQYGQQNVQGATVPPQIVINNQTVNNAGIIHGVSRKNKMVALLLCIFLGYFGAHKFYVGKGGAGILYLFTGGLFGIGWFIDIILIATGSFKDEFGLPLKQ